MIGLNWKIWFLLSFVLMYTVKIHADCCSKSQCCIPCLNSAKNQDHDPLIFPSEGSRKPYCYACLEETYGKPVLKNVKFDNNKPYVEAGTWFTIKMKDASSIKYMEHEGERTKIVTNDDYDAKKNGDDFKLCSNRQGAKIYYRAFGSSGCASPQYEIEIRSNSNGNTCSSSNTDDSRSGPDSSAKDGDNTGNKNKQNSDTTPEKKVECSESRGSIKDGVCVCTSGHAGPPDCSDWPVYQWLITIGGGLAALASICVSVHAFLQRKKRQKMHRDSLGSPPLPQTSNRTAPSNTTTTMTEVDTDYHNMQPKKAREYDFSRPPKRVNKECTL